MSLAKDLLIILSSRSGGYELLRRKMRYNDTYPYMYKGLMPNDQQPTSQRAIYTTLYRLQKNNLVTHREHEWQITKKGKAYIKAKLARFLPHFPKKKPLKNIPKSMIIIFDIPERKRGYRDWLRIELRNLGFIMLQKSVWFGPAPLPHKFIELLQNIGIMQNMKFFKASEEEIA